MPYSIFFTRIGHVIHGSIQGGWHAGLASARRLSPANATTLYALVQEQGVLSIFGDLDRLRARRAAPATRAAPTPPSPRNARRTASMQQQYVGTAGDTGRADAAAAG